MHELFHPELSWILSPLLTYLGFVLALVLLAHMLGQQRSPSSTIAWLLVILLLPYIGVPLYLMFGGRKMRREAAEKKPLPLASHHIAFTTMNDKIYAFGGFNLPASGPPAWNPLDNAWEYDPTADAWKALAPMPTKRGAAGAAVLNGKIYVVGGAASLPGVTENGIHPARPHNVLATVEEYDPATNTWRSSETAGSLADGSGAESVHPHMPL